MKKTEVLSKGAELIEGQREDDYGDAAKNFGDISRLWSVVLGTEVAPWQVAACLTQLKLARAIKTPDHEDSWVDMAGYVGLAGELATETSEAKPCLKVGDFVTTEAEYAALPVGTKVSGLFDFFKHHEGWRGRSGLYHADKQMAGDKREITKLGCGYEVGDTIEGRDAYNNAPAGLEVRQEGSSVTYTATGGGRWYPLIGNYSYPRDTLEDRRIVVKVP